MANGSWRKQTLRVIAGTLALSSLAVGTSSVKRALGIPTNQTIRGAAHSDILDGGRGDDRIFGLGGDDVLVGGPGSDRLWGGAGDDLLLAPDGVKDLVICGPGRDVAIVDELDVLGGCETVQLVRSPSQ